MKEERLCQVERIFVVQKIAQMEGELQVDILNVKPLYGENSLKIYFEILC